jgi:hypothetical protein
MLQLRSSASPNFEGFLGQLGMNLRGEFGEYDGEPHEDGIVTVHVMGTEYSAEIARETNEPFPQRICITVRKHPFSGAEEDSFLGLVAHTATTWVLSSLRRYCRHRIEIKICSEWGDRQKLSMILETEA